MQNTFMHLIDDNSNASRNESLTGTMELPMNVGHSLNSNKLNVNSNSSSNRYGDDLRGVQYNVDHAPEHITQNANDAVPHDHA